MIAPSLMSNAGVPWGASKCKRAQDADPLLDYTWWKLDELIRGWARRDDYDPEEGLDAAKLPEHLYHMTRKKNIESIQKKGILGWPDPIISNRKNYNGVNFVESEESGGGRFKPNKPENYMTVKVSTRNLNPENFERKVHGWWRYRGDIPAKHIVDIRPTSPSQTQDAFRESEHPRGQPENAGEFVAKGGQIGAGKTFKAHKAGEALPPHIAGLKIPPAWRDVHYATDPKSELLVTGRDAVGRRVAIYSDAHWAKAAAAKFARINELSKKFNSIKQQNDKNRKSPDRRVRDLADCVHLIMTMGIRPGSETDTKAKTKAYGATTLEGQHVVVDGDQVSLRFVGKKGVSLNLLVDDPETARMLLVRKHLSGDTGQLFAVNDAALRDYVHSFDGGGFKTKDFRTLLGTHSAEAEMAKLLPPKDEKSYKRSVMAVAKAVAARLGNTPTIALQSYISPAVFAPWKIAA